MNFFFHFEKKFKFVSKFFPIVHMNIIYVSFCDDKRCSFCVLSKLCNDV